MKSKDVTTKTMKTRLAALLLIAALFLTGCGNNDSGESLKPDADAAREAIDIALNYRSILEGEHNDGFTTLSSDTMTQIMNAVADMGYAVMEASGELDFKNPQVVTDFFSKLETSTSAQMTIIEICYDGGLIRSDISVKDGKRTISITRVAWKDSEPEITYTIESDLLDLRYTDNDYLIYKRDIPDNTGCNHDGYIDPTTMIRVIPLDEKCLEYCEKYISIIGYERNNLFLTDWTSEDMSGVVINDLFTMLYRESHNQELALYNCPYNTDLETGYTSIPAEDFELLIMDYFNITGEKLKMWAVYDAEKDTYPIAASEIYDPGYSAPPVPEVISYEENGDSTLTLQVDALYAEYGTDKAFSHTVTIKVEENGSFRFLSNKMHPSAEDTLPVYKNPFSLYN